jgi:DNA-directed RNA polymerase specialized sigma24 family protein
MNNFSSEHSQVLSEGLLADARHGDPAALGRLCEQIHSELFGIARAVQRHHRGSPDGGVNGESDLVQSVVAQIVAQPDEKLVDVFTIEQLRGRLFVLVSRKWIERWRHASRQKRGGIVRQASQIGASDDSSPLNVEHRGFGDLTDPMNEEVFETVNQLLSVFEPGSQRQRILLLTLAGLTQEEIGQSLHLSRDAVGRRVRNSIIPTLRRKFADPASANPENNSSE